MELLTRVWNFLPRYKTSYLVWNFLPRYGTWYPDMKLHTQEWNFLPGYETSYPDMELDTREWNFLPRCKTCAKPISASPGSLVFRRTLILLASTRCGDTRCQSARKIIISAIRLRSQRPLPSARRCRSSPVKKVVDKKRIVGKGVAEEEERHTRGSWSPTQPPSASSCYLAI
jgi:hypothetical protein